MREFIRRLELLALGQKHRIGVDELSASAWNINHDTRNAAPARMLPLCTDTGLFPNVISPQTHCPAAGDHLVSGYSIAVSAWCEPARERQARCVCVCLSMPLHSAAFAQRSLCLCLCTAQPLHSAAFAQRSLCLCLRTAQPLHSAAFVYAFAQRSLSCILPPLRTSWTRPSLCSALPCHHSVPAGLYHHSAQPPLSNSWTRPLLGCWHAWTLLPSHALISWAPVLCSQQGIGSALCALACALRVTRHGPRLIF